MKVALVLLAAIALASAYSPNALRDIASLSAQKRATNVWAVLVAGSNDYSNYRHQSDICQMFQSLRKLNVPEEHIIVMMYDDIAHNSQNPRKGVIINTPDGENVYEGVPKDYTGKLVTSKNFLKVLAGGVPTGGSGKKLASTTNDHVFVFFSDHGGFNLLGFPSDTLSNTDLEAGLQKMYTKGMYGTLIFHVEACEAGSMFYDNKLPPNAYVHTASPISESSYAWQWDDTVDAYVSDVWSWFIVHYMEDNTDKTMQELFDYTYDSMSNWSIPCQYGDLKVTENVIGEYFAPSNRHFVPARQLPEDAVKAYNVTLNVALRMYEKYPSAETKAKLDQELAIHAAVDKLHASLIRSVGVNGKLKNDPSCDQYGKMTQCMKTLSETFRAACGSVNHEYLGSVYELIGAICHSAPANSASRVLSTMKSECSALVSSL